MIFRQILNRDLSCASYFLADGGAAAVVDPAWAIDPYLELAREHGVSITDVLDTHLHADHVSGRECLASATGASSHLPAGHGSRRPLPPLVDGATIEIGALQIEAIATPGHRPEHVSFLVTDRGRSEEPCLLLCGDSLLVGDVARPDLAGDCHEAAISAGHALYGSLRRLALLPDHVEIWPGHIGGSLCAAAGVTGGISSTVGFERRANRAFGLANEEAFVAGLLERLPDPPPTVELVVSINASSEEASPRRRFERLGPERLAELLEQGATAIDGRDAVAFDAGSIPGSLSIPLDALGVGTKAAWAADPRRPVVAVAEDAGRAQELAERLVAVGFRDLRGLLGGGFASWAAVGLPVHETARIGTAELARRLDDGSITLVDLRDRDEFEALHVPGSLHLPWRELERRAAEAFAPGKPVAVACATGRRTPLGASILARHGGPVYRLAVGGIAELCDGRAALPASAR